MIDNRKDINKKIDSTKSERIRERERWRDEYQNKDKEVKKSVENTKVFPKIAEKKNYMKL